MSIQKFLIAFAAAFWILNAAITFAVPQEISAEGEYRLGDRDSRETAKMAALADAKRKIIEQVGVYVESYSEMNNFDLTRDQIRNTANAMIKVKTEEINFYKNGTVCKAHVVAIIDTDIIPQILNVTMKESAQNERPSDKKISKPANIEEYNGHYYKLFNIGMTWEEAEQFCEEMGGYLVTITSRGEQAVVQNLVFVDNGKNYYWTGGFRTEDDDWAWITGERFSYSNWREGEPNNGVGNENIITMYTSGLWNDCPAEGISDIPDLVFFNVKNSGFICEWESYDDIKKLIDKLQVN